jgi:hypothetical protein
MFSVLADYFPGSKLCTANAILVAGAYIGAGLCSLNILLVNNHGWRSCLNMLG